MPELDQSFYPAEMANVLRQKWLANEHPADVLPSVDVLIVLLDRMYQASLLREEGVPVKCRMMVAPPIAFADALNGWAGELVVLPFANPSAFTPHDIRKLATAAGYYRALLAVDASEPLAPVIWGMIITGTNWVNRFGGDRFDETPLPPNLVIQILAPGHLIVASGYSRIFESSGGKLLTEGFDPFQSTWLPERFRTLRALLLEELDENSPITGSTQLCDFFVRDVFQSMIRRVLGLVRSRGHGGMLVYLPDESADGVLCSQWFRFRVSFAADQTSLWFRILLARLIKRVLEVGGSLGLPVCKWSDYRKMHDTEIAELDDALIGFGNFLADLMSVDGALVLGRDFRLIGFGGEILGESHALSIGRACDLEAEQVIVEPADKSGTRHRSAYRLVSGTLDTIVVVVSQDGDVRFVARQHDQLIYWPYLP